MATGTPQGVDSQSMVSGQHDAAASGFRRAPGFVTNVVKTTTSVDLTSSSGGETWLERDASPPCPGAPSCVSTGGNDATVG